MSPNASRPVDLGGGRPRNGCWSSSATSLESTCPSAAHAPSRSKVSAPRVQAWTTRSSGMFAGPEVEGPDALDPLGDHRHVGDAAHVETGPRGSGPPEQEPVHQWHEGRALAARRDVTRAKVRHDGQPRALRDDRGLAQLQGGGAAVGLRGPRMVARRLAVRADQMDLEPRPPGPVDGPERRLRELLAQTEVHAQELRRPRHRRAPGPAPAGPNRTAGSGSRGDGRASSLPPRRSRRARCRSRRRSCRRSGRPPGAGSPSGATGAGPADQRSRRRSPSAERRSSPWAARRRRAAAASRPSRCMTSATAGRPPARRARTRADAGGRAVSAATMRSARALSFRLVGPKVDHEIAVDLTEPHHDSRA